MFLILTFATLVNPFFQPHFLLLFVVMTRADLRLGYGFKLKGRNPRGEPRVLNGSDPAPEALRAGFCLFYHIFELKLLWLLPPNLKTFNADDD